MLKPRHPRRRSAPEGASDPFPTSPFSAEVMEASLEDYLDHVCAPLVGIIPYALRTEMRSEMHDHIRALIAAHEELGETPPRALALALEQFGSPSVLARQWLSEWHRTEPRTTVVSARPATLIALRYFGVASLAALLMFLFAAHRQGMTDNEAEIIYLMFLGLPVFAGAGTAVAAPSRPMMGAFWALSILILPITVVAGLLALRSDYWVEGVAFGCLQFVFWMPIGCITAGLFDWFRQYSVRQVRFWALQG